MVEVCFEDVDSFDFSVDFLESWYNKVASNHGKSIGDITVIFCSDDYLLEMNQQHLSHDFFTDIITFDYTFEDTVSGDLFISVDRVKDNAQTLNHSFEDELHRVCIHGVLHLCGFGDKSEEDEKRMRVLEDEALSLRFT